MSAELTRWLTEHRSVLIQRWSTALQPVGAPNRNGHDLPSIDLLVAPELDATLEQVFEDVLRVARGEKVAQVAPPFTAEGHTQPLDLPALTRISCAFRRVVWEFLHGQTSDAAHMFALMEELDRLIDQAVEAMVRSWVDHTNAIIQEREFIAASLDSASSAADRWALQLTTLNRISQKLSASLDRDQLLNLVGSSMLGLLDIAHIAIWFPEDSGETTRTPVLRASHAWGVEAEAIVGMRIDSASLRDVTLRAFQSQTIVFEGNPASGTQGAWHVSGYGVLAFPLLVSDQAHGVVVLQDPRPFEQLRGQQDLAEGLINQTAIALQNAQLYEQVRKLNAELEQRVIDRTQALQDERDRLSTVHEIATEIGSTLDLPSLLRTSLEVLARITLAQHGSIMLMDKETGNLVSQATLGPSNATVYTRFPMGVGIAGWTAQHKKPALVDDVSKDERWVSLPEGSLRKREGAMVTVPLIMQGEVLGVLTLSHQQNGFFNEDHLRLLMASGGAIAIGIHNADLYREIVEQYEHASELRRRLQTEASQISAILQSLSDGVIVGDLYGAVLSANPASVQILQSTAEELVLSNLHDLLKRYLGQRVDEMPLNELLVRPLGHNGQPRKFACDVRFGMQMLRMTLGPVLKEDGELLGALLVIRDITIEIEADRLKTEFIGTMSHELRTPMTAIKGFTQLLAMGGLGPLNDTQREFVSTIYTNTERMIGLINDVLDITKIESGSVDLELRPLHLAEALSGVVAELRGLIERHDHNLMISIPPGLPLVRADANRLHQVLFNLLSNATKYTPRGGQIWVEAREATLSDLPEHVRDGVAAARRYARMDIRDTGVGIAPHEIDKIFQRFYRTENPLKIEAGGTGLGLSLVKPLIELLGGKIWVTSEPGVGSTFSFILPAS